VIVHVEDDFTLVVAGSSSNKDFVDFYARCSPLVKRNTLNLEDISEEEKKDLLDAADALALSAGIGVGTDGLNYRLSKATVSRLKLKPDIAETVLSETMGVVDDLKSLFADISEH